MDHNLFRRRLLADFRGTRISHRFSDVLVIGSGIAGLSAALAAAGDPAVEVLLIAKAALDECSTNYAQGGIAAVLDPKRHEDSVDFHVKDTVDAASGLAAPEVVELVVREGVAAVEDLVEKGARFDRHDGSLHFTSEGGHSRPRILHAADSTGREIERALLACLGRQENVTALPGTFAIDLVTRPGRGCCGALVHRPAGVLQMLWAKRVVLATGGAGRLWRETTNPPVTTGDGLAMAFRAGATLRDMEFVQFHPTTLYVAGAERFLITEAARGEGGRIVNQFGERFMARCHPRGELAPRDVVSRGILAEMQRTGANKVYLDLSAIPAERLRVRFPHVLEICERFGIDALREPIPVRPSAHYTIGGIAVDRDGATDVPGLFAAGEVSSTGLHGANRLGSNSLLEGLVFGRSAGRRAAREAHVARIPDPRHALEEASRDRPAPPPARGLDLADLRSSLQSLLWRHAGIERNGADLAEALAQIESWVSYVLPMQLDEPSGWTLQNMLTTAYLVVRGALRREESRGVHFRNDFPEARPEWQRHQEVSRNGASGAGAAGAADGAAPGGGPDEVPHACPGG